MNKEELKQYRSLGKEIDLLEEEIQRIRASLFSVPKMDGMPRSNYTADRTAETIAKVVDLEEKLQGIINRYIDIRTRIEASIEPLPTDERRLMRYRYIEGMSWEEIAVAMHFTYRHVIRMHGWGLRKIV